MEGATARQPSSSEAVIRTLLERKIEEETSSSQCSPPSSPRSWN